MKKPTIGENSSPSLHEEVHGWYETYLEEKMEREPSLLKNRAIATENRKIDYLVNLDLYNINV